MKDKELERLIYEMHTDIKWIKDGLCTKANKWVEYLAKGAIGTVMLTVLGAILALAIPISALAAYYNINN